MPDKPYCVEKNTNDGKETFETLLEISKLLNTGLDSKTLLLCISLCENGVHPEALAKVIKEVRQEINTLKAKDQK